MVADRCRRRDWRICNESHCAAQRENPEVQIAVASGHDEKRIKGIKCRPIGKSADRGIVQIRIFAACFRADK